MGSNETEFRELVSRLFDEYIINEMPAHLLRLHPDTGPIETIQLIDRFSLRSYYETTANEIREVDIVPNADEEWEDAITRLIKDKVRYAILSHRWVNDDSESLFQYMQSNVHVKSFDWRVGGLRKLYAFCQKARNDFNCSFAWYDMCCIDKSSSSELDEAIRSMFRWYRNSHICITYLQETDSIDDLAEEEWFKRGWTLSELLAPFRIKFYGKSWAPLRPLHESENDKYDSILQEISRITRIPETDLRAFTPDTNRVQEKMVWASNRRTRRVEDIAYSLIGIFDVSLMVAYGEGKRAFYRLMEAILQRCDHWEIFSWKGPSSSYNAALPADPSCYPAVKTTGNYDAEEQINNERYIVGDRLFSLTNHGLRIKVLLVRVEKVCDTVVEGTHGSRKRLVFSHGVLGDVELTCMHSKYEPRVEWAFGIIDFWQQYRDGGGALAFIDPCRRSRPYTAFLLSYHPNESPDARWRKEMTEDVVYIWPQRHIYDSLTVLYL
ncbi:hypothetical protein CY34DRAFT_803762 [Suillus luteus UH-Slu-Lm8-n1]|uniref:Heterokaryon incompatibility domain-containing protein n=1 Tax=Suillus luteus UH-Slu-Lm8-n1 TaxID=930992 RepID=A0A0D0BJW5_9AGAM|nr:hypothetical protein CY34DRAFT_803762 [Suillus luteus UH-Slu-Lm8-n1]